MWDATAPDQAHYDFARQGESFEGGCSIAAIGHNRESTDPLK